MLMVFVLLFVPLNVSPVVMNVSWQLVLIQADTGFVSTEYCQHNNWRRRRALCKIHRQKYPNTEKFPDGKMSRHYLEVLR